MIHAWICVKVTKSGLNKQLPLELLEVNPRCYYSAQVAQLSQHIV